MHALLSAVQSEQLIGVGLTGALVGGLVALLRLYGSGTDRIDRAAELRVSALLAELDRIERRCDAERARWAAERAELLARIEEGSP